MLKKIVWRLNFLLFHSWGIHPAVIAYTIFPFMRKDLLWRENFLYKRGYFSWNKKEKKFSTSGMSFFYEGSLPIGVIISILFAEDPFVKKNFVDNPAFKIEGPYENGQVQIEKGDTVLDMGANIGVFSVFAAKKGAEVVAFEPISRTRKLLDKNLKENNCSDIVKILPYALGDKKKEASFFVSDSSLGNSSPIKKKKDEYEERVQQDRLDDLVEDVGIKKVDFIKADIEGAERLMLAGAERVIKENKPKISICTYHLPDDPEVLENRLLSFVSEYNIEHTKTKVFAFV